MTRSIAILLSLISVVISVAGEGPPAAAVAAAYSLPPADILLTPDSPSPSPLVTASIESAAVPYAAPSSSEEIIAKQIAKEVQTEKDKAAALRGELAQEVEAVSAQSADLTDKKLHAADTAEQLAETLGNMKQQAINVLRVAEDAEKKFLREVDFGTVTEEDVPKALPVSSVPGRLDCPSNCDPSVCDNSPADVTQCFRVNRDPTGKKTRECLPFENADSQKCPQGFIRCSSVAPSRGKTYSIPVSSLKQPVHYPLVLEGLNLHKCIRLLFLPLEAKCAVEDIDNMMTAAIPIMGLASSAVFPHITSENPPRAEFTHMQILKEGEFQLCLAQFTAGKDPKDIHSVRMLGAETIGTIKGLSTNTTSTSTEDIPRLLGGKGGRRHIEDNERPRRKARKGRQRKWRKEHRDFPKQLPQELVTSTAEPLDGNTGISGAS